MGVCFSKRGEPSSPTKAHTLKEKTILTEEKKKENAAAEGELVSSAAAAVLRAKKASCVAEEKDKKKGETPLNKSFQHEAEKGYKAVTSDEQRPALLRTSSCTKEELDAILIQCGRLSRSSSGKTTDEMATAGGQGRYSGSKRSYDFDNERRKEDEEPNTLTSRPSPCRRTPSRERSGSRERSCNNGRRLSRSPGRRLDCPASSTSGCDKLKPLPTKMVSVPAREKDAPFVKGENGGRSLAANKVSASTSTGGLRSASRRSRSPNTTRMSNENPQPQSLSLNSSRKAEHSPYRRNPMAEIHENSLNQNGGSKEVEDGVRKPIQSQIQAKERQAKKADMAEKAVDAKASIGNLTRTRRSSRDLDNNQGFNTTSYASLLLEDIQSHHQQQQNNGISLPACVSKACSIVEAIADLNSCSEHRSYEADQSSNNSSLHGGFAGRGLLEQELAVKDDLMEPSLQKYVTVINMEKNVEPQESAGSNSFVGLDSVDSGDGCGPSLSGNEREVELEDEISPAENYQQQRPWLEPDGQRSRALSSTKSL